LTTSSSSTPVCTAEPGLGEHYRATGLWIRPLLGLSLAGIVVFVLLRSTVSSMVTIWYGSNTYSYGFVIAPISAFLVWRRREQLRALHPSPSLTGLALVLLFTLIWLAGNVADIQIAQQVAFIGLLDTLVWAFLGNRVVRLLRFPLLFLFFMVPTGESLVGPLQQLTAAFTVNAVRLSGIPAVQDGFVISTPSGDWRIAEACSGIRYLTSSIVVGVLFAGVAFRSWKRRVFLVLISALVPILANALRAYLIVIAAYLSNNRIAAGIDHVVYGWLFFSLVTALLIGVALGWREPEPPPAQTVPSSSDPTQVTVRTGRLLGYTAFVIVTVVLASSTADFLWSRPAPPLPVARLWSAPEGWIAVSTPEHDWAPNFDSLESEASETFTKGAREVSLYVASYPAKRGGVELINAANAVGVYGEWDLLFSDYRDIVLAGRKLAVPEYLVARGDERRVVWIWYLASDQVTASPYRIKLLQAESRLVGRPGRVALFALSARFNSQDAQAIEGLTDFVGGVYFPGLSRGSE
jgi:exosortase A